VWGVDWLRIDNEHHIMCNPVQDVILLFIRLLVGCHKRTSKWNLLTEFQLQPIQVFFAKCCAKFWNEGLNGKTTVKFFLEADIKLFLNANDTCWTTKFLSCMCSIGIAPTSTIAGAKQSTWEEIRNWRFDSGRITYAFVDKYKSFEPDIYQSLAHVIARRLCESGI